MGHRQTAAKPMTAPVQAPVPPKKGPAAKAVKPKAKPPAKADIDLPVEDENEENEKRDRLLTRINRQSIIILILAGMLVLGLPFFHTIYRYYARDPRNQNKQLVALSMANLTNKAVLSWATTSITEIMTMGFGDYLPHLKQQRGRFTPDGWDSFTKAFDKDKIGDQFKKSQLVLTTAPCNTAVIIKQDENDKHIYEWHVQMPVIMTYATNNNKTEPQQSIIELTIVRVPSSQSPAGIAIDEWKVGSNASVSELCH